MWSFLANGVDRWTRAIAVAAIIATVGLNMFMWANYYQPAIQLLQAQAVKRPVLVLSVYPSNGFNMTEGFYTFTITNTTYEFRPSEPVTFQIFLSNVGNSPTVAEYLLFQYHTPMQASGTWERLNATIIGSGESREWFYPFEVPNSHAQTSLVVQFSIVTTDTIVRKIITYLIVPCC